MITGQLMVGVDALELSDVEQELLQHPAIGGVILFTRNFESPTQLQALIRSIRQHSGPALIAVDQEGGRVQRFRDGFTELSPLGDFGQRFDENPEAAFDLARNHANTMASELKKYDIDFSFTPVLDRDCGVSTIIGNRSFHQDPDTIIKLASVYIDAMHQQKMPATAKHFPGHGSVVADSHLTLPIDDRTMAEIEQHDMRPFAALAKTFDAVMPAHIVFPAVDSLPVGFSIKWLQDILRAKLKFNGVIFSDDLCMKATDQYGDFQAKTRQALDAGCDMVLICNDQAGVVQVLDTWMNPNNMVESQSRLSELCNM